MKIENICKWIDHIFKLVVIVLGVGFLLAILWAVNYGPLKECPWHPKDPNTGECILSPEPQG